MFPHMHHKECVMGVEEEMKSIIIFLFISCTNQLILAGFQILVNRNCINRKYWL
jgi:hypothetical protein